MRASSLLSVVGFCALVVAACAGDVQNGSVYTALCEKACNASDERGCTSDPRGSDCVDDCTKGSDRVPKECEADYRAFFECGADVPGSRLICDLDDESDLPPGVCAAEKAKAYDCLGIDETSSGSVGGRADAG